MGGMAVQYGGDRGETSPHPIKGLSPPWGHVPTPPQSWSPRDKNYITRFAQYITYLFIILTQIRSNLAVFDRQTDKQTDRHLALYAFVWLCMNMYDYVWLCMTMYDYVWLCMPMYDYVWLCMTMYEYVWLCMRGRESERERARAI